MEQLHSGSTFLKKVILPIVLLTLPITALVVLIRIQAWVAAVIAFMVFVLLLGIIRNFYWNLKYVYLDEKNGRLLVGNRKEKTVVKFEAIECVEVVKILSAIVVVKLNSEIGGIDNFNFVPKNNLYKTSVATRLNKLIKDNTNGYEGVK